MDNKNFRKKVQDTFIRALKNSDAPIEPVAVNVEDYNLDLERSDKNVHLKVSAGFGKNRHPPSSIVTPNSNGGSENLSIAMVYQNQPIGEIEIIVSENGVDLEQIRSAFEQVATEMAFFIKRQQVQKNIEQTRNLNIEWIGNSDHSRQVDRFVERASLVDFPVLIQGETGSGKLLTAYSIHCHSKRKKESFIESHCLNWKDSETASTMKSLWSKASGGTLYLKDIDSLKPQQIAQIRHYWRHVVNIDQADTPRLVTSISSTDLPITETAWQELDYLSIRLPNLRDRRDDIRELTLHYLDKLSHIKNVQLSAECWDIFEQFDWSGNMQELERVVSKLVVMSDSNYLEPNALLAIIPQLQDAGGSTINLPEKKPDKPSEIRVDQIALSIANNNYQNDTELHPALSKAITFLAENYTQDISLKEISNASFVSPSHLSYLFKHHINSSFKQLLIQTRIEKAKCILRTQKHCKITEIAYDVGFHDLSHFEKTFKRIVGVSPGSYRK